MAIVGNGIIRLTGCIRIVQLIKKDGSMSYVMIDGVAVPIDKVCAEPTDDALRAIAAYACKDRRPGDRPAASFCA